MSDIEPVPPPRRIRRPEFDQRRRKRREPPAAREEDAEPQPQDKRGRCLDVYVQPAAGVAEDLPEP